MNLCRLADSARLNLQKRAALMSPSAMLALQRRTPSRSKLGQGRSWELGAGMSPAAHRLASSMRGKKDVSTSDNYQVGLLSQSLLEVPYPGIFAPCVCPTTTLRS